MAGFGAPQRCWAFSPTEKSVNSGSASCAESRTHSWLFSCSGSGFSMGLCRCCSAGDCKFLTAQLPGSMDPKGCLKKYLFPRGDCQVDYLSAWAFPSY